MYGHRGYPKRSDTLFGLSPKYYDVLIGKQVKQDAKSVLKGALKGTDLCAPFLLKQVLLN